MASHPTCEGNKINSDCCTFPEKDRAKDWIVKRISAHDITDEKSISRTFETDYPAIGFDVFREMTVVEEVKQEEGELTTTPDNGSRI